MYSEDKDYNKAHVPSYEQVLQTGGLWLEGGGGCLYILSIYDSSAWSMMG